MQILHVRNMSSEFFKEFTLMLSSLYRFKDGEELEQTRRILINWDTVTQESTVVFRRFKVIDPGVYECVILTDKGPIKTKTVLNLISKLILLHIYH